MKAWCLIRSDPVYRREAFTRGLRAAGYDLQGGAPPASGIQRGDLLVIWNRYYDTHDLACHFEAQEGEVIVAENAYMGVDRANRRRYALAGDAHNGRGCWPLGGPERWEALGVEVKPWRTEGEHVLVCPNRSFGMPGNIMPVSWGEDVAKRLARHTRRPIRIRPHPGNGAPKVPLEQDLEGAWAVVIWSSSVGVEALVRGIPVICEAPFWICRSAASADVADVEAPEWAGAGRMAALHALAWAQWSVEEIEAGTPFVYLRDRPRAFGGGLSGAPRRHGASARAT